MNEDVRLTWQVIQDLAMGRLIKWNGDGDLPYIGWVERVDAIKDKPYYELMVREIDSKTLYTVRSNRDDIEVMM